MTDTDEVMRRLSEILKARDIELRRSIARINEGDTTEAIRSVVEHVVDAMMNEVANSDVPEDSDLVERLVDAVFDSFEKATGKHYTTSSLRATRLTREIREATEP